MNKRKVTHMNHCNAKQSIANPNDRRPREPRPRLPLALLMALALVPVALVAPVLGAPGDASDPGSSNSAEDVDQDPTDLPCSVPHFVTFRVDDGATSRITGQVNVSIDWPDVHVRDEIGVTRDQTPFYDARFPSCTRIGTFTAKLAEAGKAPAIVVRANVDPQTSDGLNIQALQFDDSLLAFNRDRSAFTVTVGAASGAVNLSVAAPPDASVQLRLGFDENADGEIDDDELRRGHTISGGTWTVTEPFERLPLVAPYRVELRDLGGALVLESRGTFQMFEDLPTIDARSRATPGFGVDARGQAQPEGVASSIPGEAFRPAVSRVDPGNSTKIGFTVNRDAFPTDLGPSTTDDPVQPEEVLDGSDAGPTSPHTEATAESQDQGLFSGMEDGARWMAGRSIPLLLGLVILAVAVLRVRAR